MAWDGIERRAEARDDHDVLLVTATKVGTMQESIKALADNYEKLKDKYDTKIFRLYCLAYTAIGVFTAVEFYFRFIKK